MQNIVFDITTIQIIFMVQNKILQQKQQFKQICCRAEKKEVKSNNRHGRSCDTVHIWKVLNCWPNKDFIIWLFLPVWSLLNKMLHRNDHRSVVGYLPSTRKMKKRNAKDSNGDWAKALKLWSKGGIENGLSSVTDMTMLLFVTVTSAVWNSEPWVSAWGCMFNWFTMVNRRICLWEASTAMFLSFLLFLPNDCVNILACDW